MELFCEIGATKNDVEMQAMNVLHICSVEASLNLRYEYLKDFKALILRY